MRIVLTAAAALLAICGGSPAGAQRAPKLKPFEIVLARMVALAPGTPSPLGVQRSVGSKDILLSLPLAAEDVATPMVDAVVTVAGRDWVLKANEPILRTLTATGGNLVTLGPDARIYCNELRRTKAVIDLAPFGTFYQTCAVDSDGDGRFDKGFLVGGPAAERRLIDIAPVAYISRKQERIGGGRLDVVYHDGTALKGPSLEVRLSFGGVPEVITGIVLGPRLGMEAAQSPGETSFTRLGMGTPSEWIKTRKLPQRFVVGDGLLTVHAYDGATRRATISIDRDPALFRVLPYVMRPG